MTKPGRLTDFGLGQPNLKYNRRSSNIISFLFGALAPRQFRNIVAKIGQCVFFCRQMLFSLAIVTELAKRVSIMMGDQRLRSVPQKSRKSGLFLLRKTEQKRAKGDKRWNAKAPDLHK